MQSDLDFLNSIPSPPAVSAQSTTTTTIPDIPADHPLHAELAPLVHALTLVESASGAEDSMSEESVTALLKQLEDADLAADGIEDRLDVLLASLDSMLGALGEIPSIDNEKVEKSNISEKEEHSDSTILTGISEKPSA